MQEKKSTNDFTQGSIPYYLLKFMLPFMASNLLQVMYSLVDMIIVGRFVGSSGLSAVSQGGSIVILGTMLCLGFSKGGQTIIAQTAGAGDKKGLNRVIGTLFSSMAVVGIVMTVLTVAFRGSYVQWMKVPEAASGMARDYVAICGVGIFFVGGYNAASAVLCGLGDSKHPFIFITTSSIINLVLDLLFTGYLGWGVIGAATATAISQVYSMVVSILFLYKNRTEFGFDFQRNSFRPDPGSLKRMIRLGIPLSLQLITINLSMLVVNTFINSLGLIESATFGVGMKVDDVINKMTVGVQYAAAPMIGQNIGAKKPKRVRSVVYWTWIDCAIISAVLMALYLLFGKDIFRLFTDDPDVMKMAPVFISALVWTFPGMALMRGTNSFLHGTGNANMLLAIAIVDAAMRIVLSYTFGIAMGLGFYGFSLGFGLSPYMVTVVGAVTFFFGKWEKKLLHSPT